VSRYFFKALIDIVSVKNPIKAESLDVTNIW